MLPLHTNAHYHLAYKLLPGWLFAVKLTEQGQEFALVTRVWLELCLLVDIDKEYAKITATTPLAGLQQRLSDIKQDVDCRIPIFLFDIARGDDSRLLLGLVVLSFRNSGASQQSRWNIGDIYFS